MAKVVRIFLQPTGETFVDMGIDDNFDMRGWWPSVRKDGGAIAQFGFISTAAIHHVLVVDSGQSTTTLTVFPGGKPN